MLEQTKNTAAILSAIATPLVLEQRAIPTPGPSEILIRNHAIALNPIDWKRQAWGFAIPSYPVILGSGKYLPLPIKITHMISPNLTIATPRHLRRSNQHRPLCLSLLTRRPRIRLLRLLSIWQ